MLVLSRKNLESILIGDDIEITVVSIVGDKVRLGISAPREVPIHREEVHKAIQIRDSSQEFNRVIRGKLGICDQDLTQA